MNEQELKDIIKEAIRQFIERDKTLLELKVYEPAISHRIAVYLEKIFNDETLNFDCEYDKHGNENKKEINIITDAKRDCDCKSCKKWSVKNSSGNIKDKVEIRPDIIVHKERGNKNEGNIIAIEIKKDHRCLFDEAKLKALVNKDGNYKYKIGAFIYFSKDKPSVKWFPEDNENQFEQL